MTGSSEDSAGTARTEAFPFGDTRFRWWDWAVFATLTVAQVTVLGTVLAGWWTRLDWVATGLAFSLLLATVVVEILLWEWRWASLPLMRVPRERLASPGWRVGIAVTFVPEAEPLDMLEETIRAVLAIRYPHDTWVLDEGDDPAVRDLCDRLGARHFTRKGIARFQEDAGPFRARTKYGNYNAWLDTHGYERYDLLVAVDSDHVARPDYLDRVLGFFDDPEVAFVQPAQAYYNQRASLVARGAAEETYAYYSSILMAAQAVGYPLVVGCHNTHRVAALRQIGGFPPHEADDMVMTLLYRVSGWRGVYLPRILARGLVPADLASYMRQQRRWARSVLDYKFRVFPRRARRIPVLERILNYVHGLYYLRGAFTALQVLLLVVVLATGLVPPGDGMWLIGDSLAIAGVLLLCEAYRQRFFLDRRERGIHWRAGLLGLAKWPYFLVATVDAVRGRYGEYVVTSKGRRRRPPPALFVRVHLAVAVLVPAAWALGMLIGSIEFVAVHVGAAITTANSLVAIALVRAPWSGRAFQPELLDSWREEFRPSAEGPGDPGGDRLAGGLRTVRRRR